MSSPPEEKRPQLPAEVTAKKSELRRLEVGGESVMLDELGPVVIHEDGRLGHLSNWHEMTEDEQTMTMAFIAKRNKRRRAALLQRQAAEQSGG